MFWNHLWDEGWHLLHVFYTILNRRAYINYAMLGKSHNQSWSELYMHRQCLYTACVAIGTPFYCSWQHKTIRSAYWNVQLSCSVFLIGDYVFTFSCNVLWNAFIFNIQCISLYIKNCYKWVNCSTGSCTDCVYGMLFPGHDLPFSAERLDCHNECGATTVKNKPPTALPYTKLVVGNRTQKPLEAVIHLSCSFHSLTIQISVAVLHPMSQFGVHLPSLSFFQACTHAILQSLKDLHIKFVFLCRSQTNLANSPLLFQSPY